MTDKVFTQKLLKGFEETYRRVVMQKRQSGEMLIFSENGQIKYVDPNTVEV